MNDSKSLGDMGRGFPSDCMWSEALALRARAERLCRQVFTPFASGSPPSTWEPPVDIVETADELLVLVALPGVDPKQIEANIVNRDLLIAGKREAPPGRLGTAVIHRLELPQGRFERRVQLPGGPYENVRRSVANGCLLIRLGKGSVGAHAGERTRSRAIQTDR
jgi:HSP20 family protein